MKASMRASMADVHVLHVDGLMWLQSEEGKRGVKGSKVKRSKLKSPKFKVCAGRLTSVCVHEFLCGVFDGGGLHAAVLVETRLHHLDQVRHVSDDDVRVLRHVPAVRRRPWTLPGHCRGVGGGGEGDKSIIKA